jgi:hypothetical protein
MSRRPLLAIAALSVAAVAGPTASASAAPACSASAIPHQSGGVRYEQVAGDRQVAVYAPKRTAFGVPLFSCWKASGKLHRFARTSGGAANTDLVYRDFVVRGTAFAYRVAGRGDTATDRVRVVDGRTARTLVDSGARPAGGHGYGTSTAGRVILLPRNVVVWSAVSGVHVTRASGDDVLADGSAGLPTRLRVSGRTVTWTQGHDSHRATLPG